MQSQQIDVEGFCFYTPSDELVRNSFLKIRAPLPPKLCKPSKRKIRWVTRWKVYLLGDLSTEIKGVCAGAGYTSLMEEAVAALERRMSQKGAAYACFYGIVDLKGKPLYPRSRSELAAELDVGTWPSYKNCTCTDCKQFEPERIKIAKGVEGDFLLPPITESKFPRSEVPFRAVPLNGASLTKAGGDVPEFLPKKE